VRQPDQRNPFEHPDAQRRFRVLTGTEELARALDYPWERWIVFLHPSQADWVSRSFHGPTRVQGSAGTGKTVVALHRAAHLARSNPEARVLLTTFSAPLAALLQDKLHRLIQGEPHLLERLDVLAMQELSERMHTAQLGKPRPIAPDDLRALIHRHAPAEICRFYGEGFVVEEFNEIIDAFGLRDWESYRDVRRLGRKKADLTGIRAEAAAACDARPGSQRPARFLRGIADVAPPAAVALAHSGRPPGGRQR
jgi:hypothetical protein